MEKSLLKQTTPNSFKELKLQGITCDFSKLNSTDSLPFGEDSLFCPSTSYTFDDTASPLLYSHPFEVRGLNSEPVTYWLSIFLGFDMPSSSDLRIYLMRETASDPYLCLMDKSCVSG